ncbi:glutamate synthase large subunit [Bacillus nitroreducens]
MHQIKRQGLYNSQFEHDACGIALLANITGDQTHTIVSQALTALERLNHRGGQKAGEKLGDGSGILTEIPHQLFLNDWKEKEKLLPSNGAYGVAMIFLPQEVEKVAAYKTRIEEVIQNEKLELFGWRNVPTNDEGLGRRAKQSQPSIHQLFVTPANHEFDHDQFERLLYVTRRKIEKAFNDAGVNKEDCYIVSFSSRTIVYKGLLLPSQLRSYYEDLRRHDYHSAMAMVHNRFSTNTFPSWRRAQPNRTLMHNGEINTITGNVNWMIAREPVLQSDILKDSDALHPVIDLDGSDTAMFDNALEYLTMSGWSLPKAMMLMIPEPWQNNKLLSNKKRAFYQFHSCLMEAWDGPAAMGFTNGKQIGACLDRNGLRPARLIVTDDNFICLSSEAGVVDIPEEKIIRKDRLKPGQMLLVDFDKKKLFLDEELKQMFINEHPYEDWVAKSIMPIEKLTTMAKIKGEQEGEENLLRTQKAFGYSYEEWEKVIKPMAKEGNEPIGSMGYDAPLAVLSKKPQLLFNYFKQRFAQVTNPPIDAIREQYVTSMEVLLGAEGNLLQPKTEDYKKIRLKSPILTEIEMRKIRSLNNEDWKVSTISILLPTQGITLQSRVKEILDRAETAVRNGSNLLVISDRGINQDHSAVPSLLAVSALHHHLIRQGLRSKVSIIVESGEPREVHHFAVLLGYGANAIYPYLVYKSLAKLAEKKGTELTTNYRKSVTKGILKIMSKMGISTVQSYIGAQIFEAVGISSEVIEDYFPRTVSRIGGLQIEDIAKETILRHNQAWLKEEPTLDEGSDHQWRAGGESHLFRPETIHTLQHACRTGKYELYKKYSQMLAEDTEKSITLRGMFQLKSNRTPIPIEEVESIEMILKRFKTGAMSYGSISKEAHEAIAIAMNRIGGKSNSGEGGEDPKRFTPLANGDSKLSRIKQVASGRFGVTSHYLVNSDEIQIKMAQGAKPGEGGQLAGHKVTVSVAETRGSTPGIELISPPPHHDIYSIEDLEQLIYDLKNANPSADINVKLVSGTGVGTIAAGVAKAKADVILISGYDGGTGAAAKTSIKHAGLPWELGLAEAHQTLMLNGLRNSVRLEADGKLMNGRDVVIAALLGAEEYGFATLPLVSLGCVMMRVCHLDTCPVGIATQNPELRKKMMGTADHIVHLMTFIATEVREYMAKLGFRTMDEMIGHTDVIKLEEVKGWKMKNLDLTPLLVRHDGDRVSTTKQDHQLEQTLDYRELLPVSREAWTNQQTVNYLLQITNTDRSVGTMTGNEISKQFGARGLPEDTLHFLFKGSAGQSFGAFIPNGLTLEVEGEGNDYVGKGLSGGKIIVRPSGLSSLVAEENVIIGNAAFYGATSGKAFIRGKAGERFCVRNSGATVVVEGVGEHSCEYMTGGRAVILGEVGKNFAAGMSGGIAYIYEPANRHFEQEYNSELVLLESIEDLEEKNSVYNLLNEHYQYTKSPLAYRIIQNWKKESTRFIKVIPQNYKQILESQNLVV